MRTTKTILAVAAAAMLAAVTPVMAEEEEISLLFVQTAPDIQTDAAAKTLRLIDVSPQTVYFSDRPARRAGHISMEKYLEAWTEEDGNFGDVPPNAALSVFEPGEGQNSLVIVELFDPQVEGADLIYRYEVIDGEMPDESGPAALFIDTIGVGGGVGRGYHGVGVGRRGPGVAGWAGAAARSSSSDQ